MSFKVIEHVIPGQHIRESPHGINGRQETALQIAIKQYVPVDAPVPENGITIIGAHGNGIPKETFEPLWEDLYAKLKAKSIPVRGIWIADVSNQNASGVLNEHVQGDNTNWYDHSRDLLHMVNHFRDEMPRPIIGVAHSMGCAQLVQLSIIHPRLLSTILLYEPVIFNGGFESPVPNPSGSAARRRDLWPSRDAAEAAFQKSFRQWDPRALERYMRFGLRPVPTRLYNSAADSSILSSAVTLTTTKHQEAWSFTVPNLEPEEAGLDHLLLPDWDPIKELPYLYARPECISSFHMLPFLRPSVLWVFGSKSYLAPTGQQDAKMKVTGVGVGGSGGVPRGKVEKAIIEGGSHVMVFEQINECASVGAEWIQKWYRGYEEEERFWDGYQSKKSDPAMLRGTDAWDRVAKSMSSTKRPGPGTKL